MCRFRSFSSYFRLAASFSLELQDEMILCYANLTAKNHSKIDSVAVNLHHGQNVKMARVTCEPSIMHPFSTFNFASQKRRVEKSTALFLATSARK